MEYLKTADSRLLVRQESTTIVESIHTPTDLRERLQSIRSQQTRQNEKWNAEIAEIETMIAEAARLGVRDADAPVRR